MWKDLTMSQRADMMDLYLSKGITSLDDMRSLYDSSISDTAQGTSFSDGGSIHIKPENRGKFTALKERTGHSATWFKEHGTPAQRKMATFALNSRHWKHEYGGNLYDGTSENTQQMNIPFKIVGKGQLNPELNYGNITVGGRKGTLLSANYDTNLGRFKYDDGTEEDVQLARNFWTNSKNNNSNSSGNKTLTEMIPQYNWDRDSYLAQQSRIDEEVGNRLPNTDKAITELSNLWNYSKGYLKNKFNGDDSGILLNLADKNVSRIMSHTGDVETILTNDFIENNNNMVRKKKDFINTTDTLLGDKKIPLSKISTFYGIEDGKLKAGPLDIFDDNTVVVPNRAKYVGRIKEYHPMEPSSKEFKEAIQNGIAEYNKSKGYEPDWLSKIIPFSAGATPGGVLYNNLLKEEGKTREGRKRAQERRADIIASIQDKYSYLGKGELPYVITENNDTIRGYELNASPKTLFADENGNAIFVSSPRKHAKELNSYLKEHPMYPIMVDNGRYASYQTDFPNAEVYGGLNRPNNMFIIGTTKKKALGGNIYDGTTEDSQLMNIPYAGELPDVTVMPRRIANKAWDKVQERWVGDMPTYYAVNPETGKEEMLREIGNGKYSTYDDKHVFDVLGAEAAKKEREQWIRNGGNAGDFDKVMLGTLGLGLAPVALPEIAAGVGTALANPYVDAGLTSYFGAHGLNHAINEGIDGWGDAAMTALELAPLGRLAKPLYEGVVQPGMRLFNSPLTGNWTKIGNREYRLSPNSLGANGSSIEQRIPQITAENAASITPKQWTAAQDDAIARGDMVEAQRLRDLHAATRGKYYPGYHGNAASVENAMKRGLAPYSTERNLSLRRGSPGYFNSSSENVANTYNVFEGAPTFKTYTFMDNPYITDANGRNWRFAEIVENPISGQKQGVAAHKVVERIRKEGEHDGVIIKNIMDVGPARVNLGNASDIADDIVGFPGRSKLADAITYDNNGVRIPLGERDNFGMNDIRYGLLPFGIGLTGYGLYNSGK